MKWTNNRVAEVRAMLKAGYTHQRIADYFGISRVAVATFVSRNIGARQKKVHDFSDIDEGDLRYLAVHNVRAARTALARYSKQTGRRFVTAITNDSRLFVARVE